MPNRSERRAYPGAGSSSSMSGAVIPNYLNPDNYPELV